jgi:hypothetical protein
MITAKTPKKHTADEPIDIKRDAVPSEKKENGRVPPPQNSVFWNLGDACLLPKIPFLGI